MASGLSLFGAQTSPPMMSMCERMLTNSGAGQTLFHGCTTELLFACYCCVYDAER